MDKEGKLTTKASVIRGKFFGRSGYVIGHFTNKYIGIEYVEINIRGIDTDLNNPYKDLINPPPWYFSIVKRKSDVVITLKEIE